MKSQKGEVITITLALLVGAFVIGTFIPQINPINWFNQAAQPNTETKEYDIKDRIRTPIFYDRGNGITVAYKEEEHSSRGNDKYIHKLTLGQKIASFIAKLSGWAILIILFLVFVVGISPTVILAWSRAKIKKALKSTVSAIREMPEDSYKQLVPHLKDKHDLKDRKVIDKIKMELHS